MKKKRKRKEKAATQRFAPDPGCRVAMAHVRRRVQRKNENRRTGSGGEEGWKQLDSSRDPAPPTHRDRPRQSTRLRSRLPIV